MQKNDRLGAQLIVVMGGARSGKSSFAERMAERSGRAVAYIATATASDNEMQERIQRHRVARPQNWSTVEEPLQLADALQLAAIGADVIILDCMTVWLANWLFAQGAIERIEEAQVSEQVNIGALAETDRLLAMLAGLAREKVLIVVTNEVGLGIVPAYALGRVYRDVLGRINQRLAMDAERVYLMVAGLGIDIKRLHEEATL